MPLHNGVDTVAFVTKGRYTETYGPLQPGNIASLFAFYGLIETATLIPEVYMQIMFAGRAGAMLFDGKSPEAVMAFLKSGTITLSQRSPKADFSGVRPNIDFVGNA